ncbi:MAG: GNAT family N-acetyltransferase [Muribaculaceae bacterium]|nr:GNAT family N-acetyltransferase [Muribaculaceae bacterium]
MIENDKIILRAPEPDDVDRIYMWENDRPEAVSAPVSRLNVWNYVNNYNADVFAMGELRLVIVDRISGEAAGCIDLYDFCPVDMRGGVSVYVAESYRGRGIASAALELFESYCRGKIGLHQLWAHIAEDNRASRALFAGCGYKPAGRLRSWIRRGSSYCDVLVVQKLFGAATV